MILLPYWDHIAAVMILRWFYSPEPLVLLPSVINLKSGWQVEVSEEGKVRLWLQTESLSDSAELRLIFNDREISSSPVRTVSILFYNAEDI